MSKNSKSNIGVWLLVDALLLLAIVVIIAFVIGQAKINNRNVDNTDTSKNTTGTPSSGPSPVADNNTDTPTPPEDPTNTPTPTEAPTETPTPTEEPTPTPTEAPEELKDNATVYVNTLYVRKDAGTDYDRVSVNVNGADEEVSLGLNDRVQILDVKENWYHIYFLYKGVKGEGYVYGPFVTPDNGAGFPYFTAGGEAAPLNTGDYADTDTVWREWWYSNNLKHTFVTPNYANDMTNKFPMYGAYYCNLKATDADRVIYFTFDCGYENGNTEKILDILKANGIKACFFLTEAYLDQAPGIAKRMKDEGHLVGNHTANHPSLPKLSAEKIMTEINTVKNKYKTLTGYDLDPYLRPPMGDFSETSLKVTSDLGYKTIFWDIAIYKDFDQTYQDSVDPITPFKNWHHTGAIALIHAVSKTNTDNLQNIINILKNEGYRFGTLDELS